MASFLDRLKSALLPPVLIIAGVAMVVAGVDESRQSAAMADHGVTAEAVVDQVKWKEKKLSGRESKFTAVVHFEDAQHQRVDASLSVPTELGQRLRSNDAGAPTLTIKYLPEDPHRVALANHQSEAGLYYAMGVGAMAIGGGILWWRRRQKQQAAATPVDGAAA